MAAQKRRLPVGAGDSMAMKLAKKGGGKGSKGVVTKEQYEKAVEEARVARQDGGEFIPRHILIVPLLRGWRLLMLVICKAEGVVDRVLAPSP